MIGGKKKRVVLRCEMHECSHRGKKLLLFAVLFSGVDIPLLHFC